MVKKKTEKILSHARFAPFGGSLEAVKRGLEED